MHSEVEYGTGKNEPYGFGSFRFERFWIVPFRAAWCVFIQSFGIFRFLAIDRINGETVGDGDHASSTGLSDPFPIVPSDAECVWGVILILLRTVVSAMHQ
jgi:hypothetical protein